MLSLKVSLLDAVTATSMTREREQNLRINYFENDGNTIITSYVVCKYVLISNLTETSGVTATT